MKLRPQERRWYSLPIAVTDATGAPVTVAPSEWEASFDHGLTWHRAVANPDLPTLPAWLITHPAFPGPDDPSTTVAGQIIIPASVAPLVRLIDQPETSITPTETISVFPLGAHL